MKRKRRNEIESHFVLSKMRKGNEKRSVSDETQEKERSDWFRNSQAL